MSITASLVAVGLVFQVVHVSVTSLGQTAATFDRGYYFKKEGLVLKLKRLTIKHPFSQDSISGHANDVNGTKSYLSPLLDKMQR